MIITTIESGHGKKNLVYIDGNYAFWLYNRDLYEYGLSEHTEITDALLATIIEDTVLHRAKVKAMDILERSDRSEAELRRKLKEAMFTPDIIDRAVEYVRSFHYIDDVRLVENYIRTHSATDSRRVITNKLLLKGISAEEINRGFDSVLSDDAMEGCTEVDAAIRLINKKLNGQTVLDFKAYNKLLAFMFRKGFDRRTVSEAMDAAGISCSREACFDDFS